MMLNRRFPLLIMGLVCCCLLMGACKGAGQNGSAGVDRYNRGVAFLEQGDSKSAIVEFEAALRADPNSFEATKNLAGAFVLERNWQEALRYFNRAKEMRPDDAPVYANLAEVYRELNEPELAWDMVRTALEKDPAYPLAHYRAGELFLAQGDSEQAMKAFDDCMRLEPGSRLAFDAEDIIESLRSGEQPGDVLEGREVDEGTEEELTEEETEAEEAEEEELTEEDEQGEQDEEPAEEEAEQETEGEEEDTAEGEAVEEAEQDEGEVMEEEGESEDELESEEGEGESEDETEGEEEEAPLTIADLDLPELSGDELYQDRLSRGRIMRARAMTSLAIDLLKVAYEVHPDYAQVNYELGLAYAADGQVDLARAHLERCLELETDPVRRAEVEVRLQQLEKQETEEEESAGEEESEEEGAEEQEEGFHFF